MVKAKPRLVHTQIFFAGGEWQCSACGKSIYFGERYRRYVYSVDGKFVTGRVHLEHEEATTSKAQP